MSSEDDSPLSEQDGPNPAKRQKLERSDGDAATTCGICSLPDEMLMVICGLLTERELCALSRVSKRFQSVVDDKLLWKSIYQAVFEYDVPLFNPAPSEFHFEPSDQSELANPWKESIRQLYHGVHVCRSQSLQAELSRRSLHSFSSISQALIHTKGNRRPNASIPIVFVHAGEYETGRITVDHDVALIGASKGAVADHVTIIGRFPNGGQLITFVRRCGNAYLGHFTLHLRVPRGDILSVSVLSDTNVPATHKIEHCNIIGSLRSRGVVACSNVRPIIRNCTIRQHSTGIQLSDVVNGIVEGNTIVGNECDPRVYGFFGIFRRLCKSSASGYITLSNNNICGFSFGIIIMATASRFSSRVRNVRPKVRVILNDLHDNYQNICVSGPSGVACELKSNTICRAITKGVVVSSGGRAELEENVFSENAVDVKVHEDSWAVLRRNVFSTSPTFSFSPGSTAVMEEPQHQ